MYSDPLMVLREYIQNSTDSIDSLPSITSNPIIEITIDGRNRSLEIYDTGVGIPSRKVKNTLLSIGASKKDPKSARGFRGIGRLGGLGYCEKLVFTTKSQGERTFSNCTWDAKSLRQFIHCKQPIDTYDLIQKTTSVKRYSYSGSEKDHFFKVQMVNIHDSRNDLLNVPIIRSYLSQIAPIPFHPDFPCGKEIDAELTKHVKSYKKYTIIVNKEQIFKQYKRSIDLCRDSKDEMKGVKYVELHSDTDVLAFGWLGNLNLFGAISPASGIDGIRLRYGNILLGNKNTLSSLFKETRFNHYLVGELHIVDHHLIPNSRRDDFEDCDIRGRLYNEFLKIIGIPFSRKIRELSKERGKARNSDNIKILFEHAKRMINIGYLSSYQRDRILSRLNNINGSHSYEEIQTAKILSQDLLNAQNVTSIQKFSKIQKSHVINILKTVLDAIYSDIKTSTFANELGNKLYKAIINESPQAK